MAKIKLAVPSRTVKITRSIIERSQPSDSAHCVIAEALRGIGAKSTRVTADNVAFNLEGKRYTYVLPAKAAVELVKFDKHGAKAVKPFSFRLQAACGSVRDVWVRGPIKKAKKTGKRAAKNKKAARHCVRRFHGIRVIEVPVAA